MSSELESLKQRFSELEAKNAKLEAENAELRKENTVIPDLRNKLSVFDAEIAELKLRNAEDLRTNYEYNERRDAENAKLKAEIEELKKNNTKENAELRDRVTKVEQKQSLNDNSSNNSSSSFNSDTSLPKEPIPEVSPPSPKSSKEIEIDVFLDEVHKKKVSNEIRQRNRERKAERKKQESLPTHPEEKMSQDLNSVTQQCTTSEEKICSELDSKCKKGKGVDKLKQELFAPDLSLINPALMRPYNI